MRERNKCTRNPNWDARYEDSSRRDDSCRIRIARLLEACFRLSLGAAAFLTGAAFFGPAAAFPTGAFFFIFVDFDDARRDRRTALAIRSVVMPYAAKEAIESRKEGENPAFQESITPAAMIVRRAPG